MCGDFRRRSGDPSRVHEQVSNRDRPLRVRQLETAWRFANEDLGVRELGQKRGYWVVQQETTFLEQHHDRRAGDRFAHRVDAYDGVHLHRFAAGDVGLTVRHLLNNLTTARHHGRDAGELFAVDDSLHARVEALQALRRKADALRLGLGQRQIARVSRNRDEHCQRDQAPCAQA